MDLNLSEAQQLLASSAREFLQKESPKSLVRAMERDPRGYPPALWEGMGRLGWMGLAIPAEYGGEGATFLDLCILLEEMGRALLPAPFRETVAEAATAILLAGSEEQKRQQLPRIAAGSVILTVAHEEPGRDEGPGAIRLAAEAAGDAYLLSGTKLFVPFAHVADLLVCSARTGPREDDVSLFLVPASSPGLRITPLRTLAEDNRDCEVVFDGVRVSAAAGLLGPAGGAWPIIHKLGLFATTALCAEMVGMGRAVLEMTVTYAKERVQFGRPIGSFQAVQHRCVEMLGDIEGAEHITHEAAWRLSEGLDAEMEVAMAKAWVSDALSRTVQNGHQVHGAIGFSNEHDMQLYSRRARVYETARGDARFSREVVAQQMGL